MCQFLFDNSESFTHLGVAEGGGSYGTPCYGIVALKLRLSRCDATRRVVERESSRECDVTWGQKYSQRERTRDTRCAATVLSYCHSQLFTAGCQQGKARGAIVLWLVEHYKTYIVVL